MVAVVTNWRLNALDLEAVILHNVVREDGNEPALSNAPVPPTEAGLTFVRHRATRSLQKDSFDAQVSETGPDTADEHIKPLLESTVSVDLLVEHSQALARRLMDLQRGTASEGILVASTGTYDGKRALVVMKLERESGARTEEVKTERGPALTFVIEDELFWTEGTKVFKTALFVDDGRVLITDAQSGSQTRVANYWRRFLGVDFARNPAEDTRDFVVAATAFINAHPDPEESYHAMVGLQAELNSNSGTLTPTAFAGKYLKGAARKRFVEHIKSETGIVGKFHKDIEFVKSTIKGVRLSLDGIDITARGDAVDRLSVEEAEDGSTEITAVGTLKELHGSGGR